MGRVKQTGRAGGRPEEGIHQEDGETGEEDERRSRWGEAGRQGRKGAPERETQHQANFPRPLCYPGRANIFRSPQTAGREHSSNKTHLKTHLRSTAAQTLFRTRGKHWPGNQSSAPTTCPSPPCPSHGYSPSLLLSLLPFLPSPVTHASRNHNKLENKTAFISKYFTHKYSVVCLLACDSVPLLRRPTLPFSLLFSNDVRRRSRCSGEGGEAGERNWTGVERF